MYMIITLFIDAKQRVRAYYEDKEIDPDCALFKILNKPIKNWGEEFWTALHEDGCRGDDLFVAVVSECSVPLPKHDGRCVGFKRFIGLQCRDDYFAWMVAQGYKDVIPCDFQDDNGSALNHTGQKIREDRDPGGRTISASSESRTKSNQTKHKSKKNVTNVPNRCIDADAQELGLGGVKTVSLPDRSISKGDVATSKQDADRIGGEDLLPCDDSQKDLDANADGSEAQSADEIVIYRNHLASLPAENSKFQKCFMVGDAKQLCKETGSDFVKLFVMRCTGSDLLYRYKLLALLPDEREFAYCVLVVDPRIEDFLQDDDGGVFCALVIPKE